MKLVSKISVRPLVVLRPRSAVTVLGLRSGGLIGGYGQLRTRTPRADAMRDGWRSAS
jgi:hypothetical protein